MTPSLRSSPLSFLIIYRIFTGQFYLLFYLHSILLTADSSASCHLLKFSDDSALVGYITKNDMQRIRMRWIVLVTWCDDANLILNIDKSKELIFDFKRKKIEVDPILIRGQPVKADLISSTYLGVHLDT